MRALALIFLLYPFLEVSTLVWLADAIGGGATLLWVLASVVLGVFLLRNQNLAALLTLRATLQHRGEVSPYAMLWPLRTLLAGVLLIIPGLISDVIALILLLPLRGPTIRVDTRGTPHAGADVIEGEYTRVDEGQDPGRRLH